MVVELGGVMSPASGDTVTNNKDDALRRAECSALKIRRVPLCTQNPLGPCIGYTCCSQAAAVSGYVCEHLWHKKTRRAQNRTFSCHKNIHTSGTT